MVRGVSRSAVLGSLDRVADAVGREHASDVRTLRRAIAEALPAHDEQSYSAPEAAEELEVTLPTVHAWLRARVLERAPESRPSRLRLARARVDAVARKLQEMRRRAPRTRKLRDILEWLEREHYGDRLKGHRRAKRATGKPWRQSVDEIWRRKKTPAR